MPEKRNCFGMTLEDCEKARSLALAMSKVNTSETQMNIILLSMAILVNSYLVQVKPEDKTLLKAAFVAMLESMETAVDKAKKKVDQEKSSIAIH